MGDAKPNFRKLVRHLRVAEELKTQDTGHHTVTIIADAWSWMAFREAARQCGLQLRTKAETFSGVAPENDPASAEQSAAGQPTNQGVLPAALPEGKAEC